MKTNLWNAVVVGSAILASVFAGRFSEVAHRKGFSKRLVEDIARQKLDARAAKASDLRFYNNDTKSQFITAIPTTCRFVILSHVQNTSSRVFRTFLKYQFLAPR